MTDTEFMESSPDVPDGKDQKLLLSIVIPTYNRPESLKRCLSSLAGLNLNGSSGDLEIIVVDDGSVPSCEWVAGVLPPECCCRFLRQENKGPSAARNHGAVHARGRFLAFLDDDCSLPSDWFARVKQSLDPQRMIGGTTINRAAGIFSEASQILIDYLYQHFKHQGIQTCFLTSNNMVVPAPLFRECGGFSEAFPIAGAEDRDFCARWLSGGHEILHVPEIVVDHYHAMTFTQFFRQHFNYGFGAFIFHESKRVRDGGKIKLEPLRFYFDLLLFPFSKKPACAGRAFTLSLCMLLSQFCNFVGYAWARLSHSFRMKRLLKRTSR